MTEATQIRGSIFVQLEVSGRWALSKLTKDWTQEEVARYRAGDKEAREALIQEAVLAVMASPDEIDERLIELSLVEAVPPEPGEPDG